MEGKEGDKIPTFRSLLLSEWERVEIRVRCGLGGFKNFVHDWKDLRKLKWDKESV